MRSARGLPFNPCATIKAREFTSIGRFSPLGPVGIRLSVLCQVKRRWIDPPRAITALSRQARRIHAPVDFGKFDNEPSDSFAFGFVARPNPEDVYRALKGFSHVRDRFGAKAGSPRSEGKPQLASRCSHALRQAYHGTSERRECASSPSIFKLRHYPIRRARFLSSMRSRLATWNRCWRSNSRSRFTA